MSERSEIADRIAARIREWRLTTPFGGDVDWVGRYRGTGILFAVPRLLDGLVRVYGPEFILVETQGPLARYGSRVFTTEADAVAFIEAAFVNRDSEKAETVPFRAGLNNRGQ